MKISRNHWMIPGLAVGIVAGVFVLAHRSHEPVHDGRSLSEWLDSLNNPESDETYAAVEAAIRAMGTNALPHLLQMLQARDSLVKRKTMEIAAMQSLIPFNFRQASHVKAMGATGLSMLGPPAAPAIPALTRLLNDSDTQLGWCAVSAFVGMGEAGLQPLLQALNHSNSVVRHGATLGLGVIRTTNTTEIVSHLLPILQDADEIGRVEAARCLGRIGNSSSRVVTALVERLQDRSARVRVESAVALGALGTNASAAVPPLLAMKEKSRRDFLRAMQALVRIDEPAALSACLDHLRNTNSASRQLSVETLATLRERAKPAMDELFVALNDENEGVRWAVTNAMVLIDANQARTAGVTSATLPGRRGPRRAIAR